MNASDVTALLADALKEAGEAEAAEKLLKMLLLPREVEERLHASRRKAAEYADLDSLDGLEGRCLCEGQEDAYAAVLRLMGEEVPPRKEGRCEQCGEPFTDGGPDQRSRAAPTLCEYCSTGVGVD